MLAQTQISHGHVGVINPHRPEFPPPDPISSNPTGFGWVSVGFWLGFGWLLIGAARGWVVFGAQGAEYNIRLRILGRRSASDLKPGHRSAPN